MTNRRRNTAATVLGVVLAAGLTAGCSASGTPAAEPTPSPPKTAPSTAPTATATTATTVEVAADAAALEHIHNLGLDGDTLLIGSHQGLYRQPPGESPRRVGEPFDVMGFTTAGDRWLSSGHPGAGMNAPADLGLMESESQGKTWTDVSLGGQVDFHRLTVSGDVVVGVNSGDGLLWRSTDGGKTWDTHGAGPYDVALDPDDPQRAIGTTQAGPTSSKDGGRTWKPIPDAPVVALIAWSDDKVWGVAPDGKVYASADSGTTWGQTGRVNGSPAAIAASNTHVNVLAADTIWESLDQGRTFAARVSGIPGH